MAKLIESQNILINFFKSWITQGGIFFFYTGFYFQFPKMLRSRVFSRGFNTLRNKSINKISFFYPPYDNSCVIQVII